MSEEMKTREVQVRAALENAADALRPMVDAVFNDNGDMTVSLTMPTGEECIQAYFSERQIRAALSRLDAGEVCVPAGARGDEAEWVKSCTAKISNAIGGGSELFTRHGDQYRLDVDFVCKRISEMRERQHKAMHRAIRAERAIKAEVPIEADLRKAAAQADEQRGVGIGMAIAAGIVMKAHGNDTYARDILGAAGLDTLAKLKASGVDQYDIDLLMPVLATSPSDNLQRGEQP